VSRSLFQPTESIPDPPFFPTPSLFYQASLGFFYPSPFSHPFPDSRGSLSPCNIFFASPNPTKNLLCMVLSRRRDRPARRGPPRPLLVITVPKHRPRLQLTTPGDNCSPLGSAVTSCLVILLRAVPNSVTPSFPPPPPPPDSAHFTDKTFFPGRYFAFLI